MAHWAEIDDNNIVLRVTVGDNEDPNGDEGYQWLIDNLGGRWIKTSYNNKIRKQYAGIGFYYDEQNDVFIAPKPFASWTLDENFDWQPPVKKPEVGIYIWNEDALSWEAAEPYPSWIPDGDTWVAPVAYPNDGRNYTWNEEQLSWVEASFVTPNY